MEYVANMEKKQLMGGGAFGGLRNCFKIKLATTAGTHCY